MSENYIGIDGVIETNLLHEVFLNEFIKWIEYKGFRFCGSTRTLDENGNTIKQCKTFTIVN